MRVGVGAVCARLVLEFRPSLPRFRARPATSIRVAFIRVCENRTNSDFSLSFGGKQSERLLHCVARAPMRQRSFRIEPFSNRIFSRQPLSINFIIISERNGTYFFRCSDHFIHNCIIYYVTFSIFRFFPAAPLAPCSAPTGRALSHSDSDSDFRFALARECAAAPSPVPPESGSAHLFAVRHYKLFFSRFYDRNGFAFSSEVDSVACYVDSFVKCDDVTMHATTILAREVSALAASGPLIYL